MCEPITLMTMASVASAGGMGLSMYGQRQQGKAAEQAGEYNAKMKELAAESAGDQAAFEARQLNSKNRQAVAAGRVSAAGGGLDLSGGSVLDWEGDMRTALDTDLAAIRHNASLEQFGLKAGANLDRANGRNAKTASYWNMGATALSGVGQIGGGWAQFNQAGK